VISSFVNFDFLGIRFIKINGIIPIIRSINPDIKKISWKISRPGRIKNPTKINDIPACMIVFEFNIKKYFAPFLTLKFCTNLKREANIAMMNMMIEGCIPISKIKKNETEMIN